MIIDLVKEYEYHAATATTDAEREDFLDTRDRLEAFRAAFQTGDFPDKRVRVALVVT